MFTHHLRKNIHLQEGDKIIQQLNIITKNIQDLTISLS